MHVMQNEVFIAHTLLIQQLKMDVLSRLGVILRWTVTCVNAVEGP